jgi:hypothetical protein
MLLAAHQSRRGILDSRLDLNCRRWHPAKTPGVLRIASPVLHILSRTKSRLIQARQQPEGERQRRNISARKVSELTPTSETHFSKAQPQVHAILRGTHGLQQAWMNSRNQTTIATLPKHRQLMFLHPTANGQPRNRVEGKRRRLAESASSLYTTGFPFQFII